MAYLDIDLLGPIKSAFLVNTKARNLLLNNAGKWPTKWVDGFEVFDELNIGNRYAGAIMHKTLYKVLGIKYSDLSGSDLSQVERLWLYLKPKPFVRDTITDADVIEFINNEIKLYDETGTVDDPDDTGEVTIDMLYTQTIATNNLRSLPPVSNEQIVAMIEGGYNSIYPTPIVENVTTEDKYGNNVTVSHTSYNSLIEYDTKTSNVTFASLMDTNDDLFTSETKIISKSITPVYSTSYLGTFITSYTIKASATYTFRRVSDASDVVVSPLVNTIVDKANTSTDTLANSMFRQIMYMARYYNPIVVSTDLYLVIPGVEDPNGEGNDIPAIPYVKVGTDRVPEIKDQFGNVTQVGVPGWGVRGMKRRAFVTLFASLIESDFQQYVPKKKWYSGLITIVLIVVIIVVSIYTAGAASGVSGAAVAAGTAGTVAAATFMSALAISLTISSLIVGTLGTKLGGHSATFSYAMRDALVTVGKVAEIVGLIATVLAVINIANMARKAIGQALMTEAQKETAKQAAIDAAKGIGEDVTKEAIQESIDQAALKAFSNASMGDIMVGIGDAVYDAIVQSAENAWDNVVGVFSGDLFSNMSTGEIIAAPAKAIELYNALVPHNDPSEPVVEDVVPIVPDKIEYAELVQRSFDSPYASVFETVATEDMVDRLVGYTIRSKFDRCYINNG